MLNQILNWEYVFKTGTELIWAVVVAVITTAAPIIAGADLAAVLAEPKTWLVALAAACARAAGVAFMVALRKVIAALFGSEAQG